MKSAYKVYEHLCYITMEWACNKGIETNEQQSLELKQKRNREIYDNFEINYGYANNKWNKHFNEIMNLEIEK